MLARMPVEHRTRPRAALVAVGVALSAVLALSACGGSSKPSYCSQVNNLKNSIEDLGKVNVLQNGTGALTSALSKVESSAKSVVDSAKGDFPSQTSAISSSVSTVKTTVTQLVSNPKQPALIAELPGQVGAVSSSISTFISDTQSKCK